MNANTLKHAQAQANEQPSAKEAVTEEALENFAPLADQLPDLLQWLPEPLQPAWQAIADYPILGALVIAVAFYALAWMVRIVVIANIGRLAARSGTHVDDALIQHLRRPIFYTIFLSGLMLAVNTANLPFGRQVIINLLASWIVAAWMIGIIRLTSSLLLTLERAPRATLVEARTIPLIDLVAKLVVLLVGSYVLLMVWGINPVGWLASAGIVGIAVGFAAKDTLANLFSGFFILADSPYKLGDYINLDTGERGKVVAIGMRSTRLLTRDDVEITVPNAVIAAAKITNESGGPYEKVRVRMPVGVAYGSDLTKVCALLTQVAERHQEVCTDPEPRVRMRAFGASSIDFELLAWIDQPEKRGLVLHELMMHTYETFAAEAVEIPFSQHDLHIKEWPGQSTEASP